jgi:hypothetical protein
MALSPKDVEELSESIKKLVESWMRIKLVFIKAFGNYALTREQENAYLQLKSDLSRIFRGVTTRLPSGLQFEGEKMIEMLKNAITMEHLRSQPPEEKQAFFRTWHQVYIRLVRTQGALGVIKAGYYPQLHRARLTTKTSAKKAA